MAIKVKLHRDAFDALRNSGPVLAELERQGQQVASRANAMASRANAMASPTLKGAKGFRDGGPLYVAKPAEAQSHRGRVGVITSNAAAMIDNRKHQTLLKALKG